MKFILLEAPLKIIFMGATIDIYGYLQLHVGWKVTPGRSTTTTYDVTYTPFAWGMTRGRFNGTTWPTMGTVETTILYVDVSVPIGVTLSTNRQNCFRGKYRTNPANLQTNMYASLLGCEVEIIDNIINQQPISLGSNRVLQEWARIIMLDTPESIHGAQKSK